MHRNKEAERSQTQNQERSRDRSPIAHTVVHASAPAVISVTSLSTSSVTITSNSHSRKNQPIGVATQQVAQPLDIRSSVTFRPINDVTFLGHDPLAHRLEATKDVGRVAVKPRTPAIVRPFETTPSDLVQAAQTPTKINSVAPTVKCTESIPPPLQTR
ncbi:hypothetical protein C7M84_003076 [Penaeus vannamei]|uniref:Uncharacterized protein n=1 Tax=Penaeus vannamei TaxID=6689 RepID=A0A3R7SW80_PENVA|nr:hypothetical protein C7M84_003076 [Penaeus vannamei]